MAEETQQPPKVQLQTPQIELDRQLLRDDDLLNEEHLHRMDQVLLRRNLDHVRMFSRKLSLELQNFVHLYTPEANELRRRIEKYMVMERMIEKEMARRHTYGFGARTTHKRPIVDIQPGPRTRLWITPGDRWPGFGARFACPMAMRFEPRGGPADVFRLGDPRVGRRLGRRSQRHPHPAREPRHRAKSERHAALAELIGTPASELAPCGDPAHDVVYLGPGSGSTTMAEADEVRHLLGRTVLCRRFSCCDDMGMRQPLRHATRASGR